MVCHAGQASNSYLRRSYGDRLKLPTSKRGLLWLVFLPGFHTLNSCLKCCGPPRATAFFCGIGDLAMAGRITALRYQKHDDQRVNVYLDGEYAFALPALVAAGLKNGQDLDDAQIAALKAENEEEQAHDRALQFLSFRPRSVAEVRHSLETRQIPTDIANSVIQRLLAAGYLDDQAFAQFWVADRERFKPRAPVALRQELRLKGVPEDIIAQALGSLDSESSAYRAGAAYSRRLSNLDQRTFRQKLGNHLLRRGFQHDVVWPVVDRLWREQRDDTEGGESPDDDT